MATSTSTRSTARSRSEQARVTDRLSVAVLGAGNGWHGQAMERALTARGHVARCVPITRVVGEVTDSVALRVHEHGLEDFDVVLVRGIPRGSLEQIIYRVDLLHLVAETGARVVNGAGAIERTVDKFLASALLARAGIPTPRTIACERREDALAAFHRLGGDVIVKPLFGSMGHGITWIDDPDVAYRVFAALELERAVYYVQERVPHGGRDVRALVIGSRVAAAIERTSDGWRTNLSRGGRARAADLTAEQQRLCVQATRALGADYAGVDLLTGEDGRDTIVEVNGIPGWQGLQRATGIDVAAALVEHVETTA